MICFHCKQEIKNGELEWFGLDGDAIHKSCRPLIYQDMNRLASMSDYEFYNYMGVGHIFK